jgi:DNA polymerase
MRLHLPSGRAIHYHNVRFGKYLVTDPKTGKKVNKEGWRYQDSRSPRSIGTYGGRLTENVTQAVARDIMGEALVRLHDRGYRIAAHVHDEILVEGEHDVAEISKIMCEMPEWAEGLPLDGEGFVCQRYRKG